MFYSGFSLRSFILIRANNGTLAMLIMVKFSTSFCKKLIYWFFSSMLCFKKSTYSLFGSKSFVFGSLERKYSDKAFETKTELLNSFLFTRVYYFFSTLTDKTFFISHPIVYNCIQFVYKKVLKQSKKLSFFD